MKPTVKFNSHSLVTLVVEKTYMNPGQLKYLSSIFLNCIFLKEITLEDIIGIEHFHNLEYGEYLIASLQNIVYLDSLKKFSISRNHLKDNFFKDLVPILQKTKIEELDISCNNISDDGFLYLCPYFNGNQHLRLLNMNYNKFKIPTAARCLADALSSCPRLNQVDFKLCRITDEIIPELVPLITPKIKLLNLSHNKITKDGFIHLADKFKAMAQTGDPSQIQTLVMKSNELNDFCIDNIRDIIMHCKELRIFDIAENLFLSSYVELVQLRYHYKV